jgi:tellurite resistance protein TerC
VKYGLSLVLVFIGVKMLVNEFYHAKIISTEWSLLFTVGVIGGSMVVSMLKTRKKPAKSLATGWVPGSSPKKPEPPVE